MFSVVRVPCALEVPLLGVVYDVVTSLMLSKKPQAAL
jgi:hypothetical protein